MNEHNDKVNKMNDTYKYELHGSNAQFKNMEYNALTADLRAKYGNGLVIKEPRNPEDLDISQALNILTTMLVLGAALGFVGYGIGGVVYAGFGACIGIFIGMVVDTLLVIIYSSGIGKPKAERVKPTHKPLIQQKPQNVSKEEEHVKND